MRLKILCDAIIAAGISFSLATPVINLPEQKAEVVPFSIEQTTAYSDSDLFWLSRVIYAEAGADWCSNELQLAVGSVVLNRVKSNLYPNTIESVIFDTRFGLQYGCIRNGMIYLTPDIRAMENARRLLSEGSVLPDNVLAQCNKTMWGNRYCTIQGVVFSAYR